MWFVVLTASEVSHWAYLGRSLERWALNTSNAASFATREEAEAALWGAAVILPESIDASRLQVKHLRGA